MTKKQRKAFDFIQSFIGRHGFSPSIREVRDGIGDKSQAGVFNAIIGLEEMGYLRSTPGRARSLELVARTPDLSKIPTGALAEELARRMPA